MAPKAGRNLNRDDGKVYFGVAQDMAVMTLTTGDPMNNPYLQANMKMSTELGKETKQDGSVSEKGDQMLKEGAQELADRVGKYMEETSPKLAGTPHTNTFHQEILKFYKNSLEYLSKGISVVQDKELHSMGMYAVEGYCADMGHDMFAPENLQKTEEALKQFPLDVFLKKGNELQAAHLEYELGKENRSLSENARILKDLKAQKLEFLSLAKDLRDKGMNPTPETMRLFGSQHDLNDPTGYMNDRGLGYIISTMEKELGVKENNKTYPWEVEGKDFNTPECVTQLGYGVLSFAMMMDWDEAKAKGLEKRSHVKETEVNDYGIDVNDPNEVKLLGSKDNDMAKQVAGAVYIAAGDRYKINIGKSLENYCTPEQVNPLMEKFDGLAKFTREVSTHLRNKYADKKDEKSRHLQERANRFADYAELKKEAYDPRAGNMMEAMVQAPYIVKLNTVEGGMPKIEAKGGIEECIRVMDQSDVPGGQSIFDDYMTVMEAASKETKIQYHRQKMEADGWNSVKEQTYLRELRTAHQATVEAFDRLWQIDDKGQYDSVLNNGLDHLVGKDASNVRDGNDGIGYMRGEMQAIDMGYDSHHLYVLGQIGLQEQMLKKKRSEWKREIAKNDQILKEYQDEKAKSTPGTKEYQKCEKQIKYYQEENKQLNFRIDTLEEYQKDFDTFKASVWNQKVHSQDEMEAVEEKVNQFFAAQRAVYTKAYSKAELEAAGKEKAASMQERQKIYKAIQESLDSTNDSLSMGYQKEKAATFELDTRLTARDYEEASKVATTLTAWKIDEEAMPKGVVLFGEITRKVAPEKKLPSELDRKCKDMVGGWLTTVNRKISELEKEPSKYPHAMALQKAFLSASRNDLENYCAGIPVNKESVYREAGYGHYFSMTVQLEPECFQSDKLEATEKAVQEYGLDKHAEAFLKLQERHQAYEMGKDYMQPAERRQAYQELMADKRHMLQEMKELQQKMANPTPELITLFSGDKKRLNDFLGPRGLQGLIDSYERDLARTDDIDKAMERFNSARAAVFKNESPEHKQMQEAGEKVRENMKMLQNGVITDNIDKAMERFNSARAAIFTNESPEHKQMREAGEKVQENMKMLQSGVITDKETGKKHAMSEQERDTLLKETWASLKTLEAKTDQYIAHATKNGTKLPHTPAGKARLAGALDLQKLTGKMKDQLGREPVLKDEYAQYARDLKMAERAKIVGTTGAEQLARMDEEVNNFAKMSQAEYHDQTPESMAYGLDKCQYQAARVIAIAAVEEAAMQRKVSGKDIQREVMSNTRDIASKPEFQKWVKDATATSRMKDLGKLSAQEIRANFVEYMSKNWEKDKDLEKGKNKEQEKGKNNEQEMSTDKKEKTKTEKTKTEKTKTEKTKVKETKVPVPVELTATKT